MQNIINGEIDAFNVYLLDIYCDMVRLYDDKEPPYGNATNSVSSRK